MSILGITDTHVDRQASSDRQPNSDRKLNNSKQKALSAKTEEYVQKLLRELIEHPYAPIFYSEDVYGVDGLNVLIKRARHIAPGYELGVIQNFDTEGFLMDHSFSFPHPNRLVLQLMSVVVAA